MAFERFSSFFSNFAPCVVVSFEKFDENHAQKVHAKEVFPGKADLCGESTKCSDSVPAEAVAVKKKVEKAKARRRRV